MVPDGCVPECPSPPMPLHSHVMATSGSCCGHVTVMPKARYGQDTSDSQRGTATAAHLREKLHTDTRLSRLMQTETDRQPQTQRRAQSHTETHGREDNTDRDTQEDTCTNHPNTPVLTCRMGELRVGGVELLDQRSLVYARLLQLRVPAAFRCHQQCCFHLLCRRCGCRFVLVVDDGDDHQHHSRHHRQFCGSVEEEESKKGRGGEKPVVQFCADRLQLPCLLSSRATSVPDSA
eukprot:684427-Rhodomonas_salina.1